MEQVFEGLPIDFSSQALVEATKAEIELACDRDGFASRFLLRSDELRVDFSKELLVRHEFKRADLVEESDGQQLESAILYLQESANAVEDRMLFGLLRSLTVPSNTAESSGDAIKDFVAVAAVVTDGGKPVEHYAIPNRAWSYLISHMDAAFYLDPPTQHSLVLQGRLGILLGRNLNTDAYRFPGHRVLEPAEIWALAPACALGKIRRTISEPKIEETKEGFAWSWTKLVEIEGLEAANFAVLHMTTPK